MLRSILGLVAILAFGASVVVAQDPNRQQQPNLDPQKVDQNQPQPRTPDQVPARDQKNATDADKAGKVEATITDVDRKNGTIKVRLKDAQGKEVERTFKLTGDIRYFDSTGKAAAIDIFRSGNQVLIIEREGNLKEVYQNRDQNPTEGQKP